MLWTNSTRCWVIAVAGWVVTYPEITEMQARAIIEAALNVKAQGIDVHPEIMVPLVGVVEELRMQAEVIHRTAAQVFEERGDTVCLQSRYDDRGSPCSRYSRSNCRSCRLLLIRHERLDSNDVRLFS